MIGKWLATKERRTPKNQLSLEKATHKSRAIGGVWRSLGLGTMKGKRRNRLFRPPLARVRRTQILGGAYCGRGIVVRRRAA